MVRELTYPKNCRKNIRRLMDEIGTDAQTSYGMMLLTATLMDLNPEDEAVVHMILQDCGIEDSEIA